MTVPAVHESRLDADMGRGKRGTFQVMALAAERLKRLREQGLLR